MQMKKLTVKRAIKQICQVQNTLLKVGGYQLTKPLIGAQHFPLCKDSQDFLYPSAMFPDKRNTMLQLK